MKTRGGFTGGRGRAAALAALVATVVGCLAAVGGPYDTSQCYWTWVNDMYGGYEQLHCWNGGLGGYHPYAYGGGAVRRYPGWYRGQRVVVTPPRFNVVRPRGVVVVPPPAGPVPWARPAPH